MNAPLLRNGRRGFTLVELMVSLTGGLFLSIVVFALARDGQRFYQRESRLANATLSGIAGFNRLRTDIARAGFLTTPNIDQDTRLCSRPGSPPWPLQLAALRSLTLNTGLPPPTALANNTPPITPHRILLAGSYASTDEFPIRSFSANVAGAQQIFLQANSGAMARLGYATSANQQALLASVFGPGRAVRLVDREGMQHYAVVSVVTGGTSPSITLAPNPPITLRSGGAIQCGTRGFETGATLNVVNFIQYDIGSLSTNPNYTKLFTLSAAVPGENQRTELVRTEISAAGTPVAGSQELVAEYAVDLRFGLTGVTGLVGVNPVIGAIAPGQFANFAGATGTAQRIRAVRARLSVRSREADREVNVPAATAATGLYRFMVLPGQFARVRTFQADIALHNHSRILW